MYIRRKGMLNPTLELSYPTLYESIFYILHFMFCLIFSHKSNLLFGSLYI